MEMNDDFLMKVAGILGSSSAAARAIAERDRRVALGEDVCVLWDRDRGLLLVGPNPNALARQKEGGEDG
jgi:hypothetical protein